MTISFSGGSALTVKTNTGNDVAAGGLTSGMVVLGIVSGSTFRILNDQVSSAIVAAAEAAQAAAEAAAAAALAAVPNTFALTRTALKALNTSTITAAYLREAGREGQFLWRTGDYSAQIAADTAEGIYIKANAIAATAGAWVRNTGISIEVNVRWFGAVGDGVTADTAAFQVAANLSKKIRVPFGRYFLTATITLQAGTYFEGDGREQTILQRTGDYGDTLKIGSTSAGAGNFRISGFWFYKPQNYVAGTTTTITNPVGNTTAHVRVVGGQDCDICDNYYWNVPYGIVVQDTSLLRISRNNFLGIWDTQIAGLQEGRAHIYLAAGLAHNTLITIDNNHVSGGYFSALRSKTIGTVTYSINEQIGPLLGLLVETCEGLNVFANYFGGQSQYCIAFSPIAVIAQPKIHHNFFDTGRDGTIKFLSGTNSAIYPTDVIIDANGFNGQQAGPEAISFNFTSSIKSAVDVIIANNVFENHLMAPVRIDGAIGVKINGNIFTAYHNRGGGTTPDFTAGVFLATTANRVNVTGNDFGGGTNDPMGGNNCQYGVYYSAGSFGYASGNFPYGVGLGMGGGAIANVTQTYPT
nr:glycoside hydrolase family 55 protein [Rhizobium leucaenae]